MTALIFEHQIKPREKLGGHSTPNYDVRAAEVVQLYFKREWYHLTDVGRSLPQSDITDKSSTNTLGNSKVSAQKLPVYSQDHDWVSIQWNFLLSGVETVALIMPYYFIHLIEFQGNEWPSG